MKLTKGKISKLYNKKKQSLKKEKQRKITKKGQTFRKYKRMNLAKKTLKNFNYNKVGGEGEGQGTLKIYGQGGNVSTYDIAPDGMIQAPQVVAGDVTIASTGTEGSTSTPSDKLSIYTTSGIQEYNVNTDGNLQLQGPGQGPGQEAQGQEQGPGPGQEQEQEGQEQGQEPGQDPGQGPLTETDNSGQVLSSDPYQGEPMQQTQQEKESNTSASKIGQHVIAVWNMLNNTDIRQNPEKALENAAYAIASATKEPITAAEGQQQEPEKEQEQPVTSSS
jgi:hypothetical protein